MFPAGWDPPEIIKMNQAWPGLLAPTNLIPVKGGEGGTEVRVLVVVEETLQLGLRLPRPPDSQVVARGGQQV